MSSRQLWDHFSSSWHFEEGQPSAQCLTRDRVSEAVSRAMSALGHDKHCSSACHCNTPAKIAFLLSTVLIKQIFPLTECCFPTAALSPSPSYCLGISHAPQNNSLSSFQCGSKAAALHSTLCEHRNCRPAGEGQPCYLVLPLPASTKGVLFLSC